MTDAPIHDPSRPLDDAVAGCAAAHQRLLASLDSAVESDSLNPASPSLLPDWTIGHLLTHLARNADGIANIMNGAAAGEERLMYPSAEARDNDINEGSTRPAQVLVDDLRKSCWAVESSWARLSSDAWNGYGLARGGRIAVAELPFRRWREVEIHQADLGLAFGAKDWSPAFLAIDLPTRLAEWTSAGHELPAEVASAASWQQLAWLFGRASGLATPAPKWV
jgi:maleylpyruvate isomerase